MITIRRKDAQRWCWYTVHALSTSSLLPQVCYRRCDLESYAGGLEVGKHMYSLLDADQLIPWQDKPLRYYQKYR